MCGGFFVYLRQMGTLKKTEWTEKLAQDKLRLYFMAPNTKKYEMMNLFIYGWESDYLAVTKSMVAYEVEIKISKEDFKNDLKKKTDKHLLFENGDMAGRFPKGSPMPNYFYYAVPDGLILPADIPSYAGLIYLHPWGVSFEKEPKKLTDEKFDPDKMKLADKFYYNMWNWRDKYDKLSNYAEEIKLLKKQIRGLNENYMMVDDRLSEEVSENEALKREIEQLKNEIKRRDTENGAGTVPEN